MVSNKHPTRSDSHGGVREISVLARRINATVRVQFVSSSALVFLRRFCFNHKQNLRGVKTVNLKQELREKLSLELRKLRQERGLSIQEVALMSPLSIQMIYDMEQGNRRRYNLYQRLLKFYGKRLEFTIKDLE